MRSMALPIPPSSSPETRQTLSGESARAFASQAASCSVGSRSRPVAGADCAVAVGLLPRWAKRVQLDAKQAASASNGRRRSLVFMAFMGRGEQLHGRGGLARTGGNGENKLTQTA